MKVINPKEAPWNAYAVYWKEDPSYCEIVYADRASLAKSAVANHSDSGIVKTDGQLINNDLPFEYIELGAKKLPAIYDMALQPLSDIALILVRDCDWVWSTDDGNGDIRAWASDDLKTDEDVAGFKETFDD